MPARWRRLHQSRRYDRAKKSLRVDDEDGRCYARAACLPDFMRAVDIIRKKRDALELTREEIEFLIRGCTRGEIPDYQISAWLMAVWVRRMSGVELAALAEALRPPGALLGLSGP